jgi:hypothetical protein
VDVGESEKSADSAMLKVAVTSSLEVMVMIQVLVPEQGPLQPENVDPDAEEAVRTIVVPAAKLAEHKVPQRIPAGLLMTSAFPFPASATVRLKLVGPAPPSITVTLPLLFAT